MSDYSSSTNPFQPYGDPLPERVGFGSRLGAWIIDLLSSILFGVLLGVLLKPLGVGMSASIASNLQDIQDLYSMLGIDTGTMALVEAWYPALTLGGIIGAIMYVLIEGLTGASPGKRILHIAVAHQDGSRGTTALWMRRCVVKSIGSFLQIFTLVPALGFIEDIGGFLGFVIFIGCFLVLGQDRLALHDRIALTAVFHREDIRS